MDATMQRRKLATKATGTVSAPATEMSQAPSRRSARFRWLRWPVLLCLIVVGCMHSPQFSTEETPPNLAAQAWAQTDSHIVRNILAINTERLRQFQCPLGAENQVTMPCPATILYYQNDRPDRLPPRVSPVFQAQGEQAYWVRLDDAAQPQIRAIHPQLPERYPTLHLTDNAGTLLPTKLVPGAHVVIRPTLENIDAMEGSVIRYYVNRGEIHPQETTLGEPTRLVVPDDEGPVELVAILRTRRGDISWVRIPMTVNRGHLETVQAAALEGKRTHRSSGPGASSGDISSCRL